MKASIKTFRVEAEGRKWPITLFEGDWLAAHYRRTTAPYEADLLTALRAEGEAGVWLDVGANVGNHSLYWAHLCPQAKAIVAFEPSADTRRLFRHNLKAHSRVRLSPVALSSASGSLARLQRTEGNTGGDKWGPVEEPAGSVLCRALDDEMADDPVVRAGARVAVIKIDVEGMEAAVLMGAITTLREHSPLLAIEAHRQDDVDAQTAILAPLGYVRGRRYCASPTYLWRRVQ